MPPIFAGSIFCFLITRKPRVSFPLKAVWHRPDSCANAGMNGTWSFYGSLDAKRR